VDRSVSWQNIEVRLDEGNKLLVTDYHQDITEVIDFRDRLIDMTIGYGFLIVVTNSQCHVYNVESMQTPYSFDLKEKVKSILTSPKYFALIDDNNGINVYLNLFRSVPMMESQFKVLKYQVFVFPH
jgi:intraflagellar transport protein 80